MKKVFLLFILASTTIFAQQRISKNLSDIDQVKIFSGLNVKLIRTNDAQNHIEIKGSNSEDVLVKNVNGVLKLSVSFPNAFDEDSTLIKLYYTKDLDVIDVNEGAVVMSDKPINQDYIEIKGQEGAQVELRLEVKNLKVKSISGAEISLSGNVESQKVLANTGGIYDGFDLVSKQADVISSTGAEVEVNTTGFLNAKAKLKGLIIYKNTPKKIIKKEVIGGKVYAIKNYKNTDGSLIYND